MGTFKILYRVKTATLSEILTHLIACNNDFHLPLSERIDIKEYSQKLFEKSITFEAWAKNTLVGLVAAYFKDISDNSAFITNVSVLKDFMGQGIASKLLQRCVWYAVKENIREIRLEVNKSDNRALRLYKNSEFVVYDLDNDFLKMKMELTPGFDKY